MLVGSAACGKIVGAPLAADASGDSGKAIDADTTDASITQMVNVITQTHVTGGGAVGSAAPNIAIIAVRPNGTTSDSQTTSASGSADREHLSGRHGDGRVSAHRCRR